MKVGRVRYAQDFGRLLRSPVVQRSVHFAVHHVSMRPDELEPRQNRDARATELSTSGAPGCTEPVDESDRAVCLACVVPKRHARRAVTRNLLKRQVRAAVQRLDGPLAPGLWLVRLRAAFDTGRFRSAGSPALRCAARAELDDLLLRCRDRASGRRGGPPARAGGPARQAGSPGLRDPKPGAVRTGRAHRG